MADLRHLLATYVHAHQTGNSVPPHIAAEARAALAAEPTFIASEPSDEDLEDLAEVFNGDPLPAMRRALELWGRPTVATLAAEPPAPADPSDFQTLQGIALDMVESLRPIVLPEILGVLRRAIKQAPAPTPAADSEREELAMWLDDLANDCNDYDDLYPPESSLKLYRAAALLREARPQPVPVAERPWERPGWCDADGQCWWGRCADDFFSPEWTMATLASIEEFCSDAMPRHCLPHWAVPIPQPPQAGKVGRWPETYSRRQRAEEAERLCTEAGIDLKSPDAQRLVRDAENGMPLHDVLDLIKHWNATITTEPPTDD